MPLPHTVGSLVVADYFNKKNLANMGYRFEGNDLMDWEVEAFNTITNIVNEESRKKSGRHKR